MVLSSTVAARDNDFEELSKRRVRALQLWDAAKPIHNTLAARYLADIRGIDLDALPATSTTRCVSIRAVHLAQAPCILAWSH